MSLRLPVRSFAARCLPVAVGMFPVLLACMPLVLPGAAYAQTRTLARVDVPFDFTIGQDRMRAGSYRIVRVTENILRIQAEDSDVMKNMIVYPVVGTPSPKHGRLVFHQHGSRYFLADFWLANVNSGYHLPRTKAEKEAVILAANAAQPTETELALNVQADR